MLRTPIVITEHQTYVPSEDFDIYSFLTAHNVELPGIPADYMGTPQCLAIDSTLTASYYIAHFVTFYSYFVFRDAWN